MGKIIQHCAVLLGKLLSCLYPYSVSQKTSYYINTLYTAWISPLFKHIGVNSIIHKKATIVGAHHITIGNNVEIYKNAIITAWDKYGEQTFNPEIIIGDGTTIAEYCHISAVNKMIFGKNSTIGSCFTVVDNSHGEFTPENLNIHPMERPISSKGTVTIGDNVWIGDKVTVMPGVTIGKNTIIGANSVVTKNIPENCLAAGNPAKIIKSLQS